MQNLTHDLGLEFAHIPAGAFWMGSTDEQIAENIQRGIEWAHATGEEFDPAWPWRQAPRHRVVLSSDFYIMTTPVTNAMYRRFRPHHDSGTANNLSLNADQQPVVHVHWDNAMEFAHWLSAQTGHSYRLPTEAEWEYACRAGSESIWPWGDDQQMAGQYANISCRTKAPDREPPYPGIFNTHTGFLVTAPVKSFLPNRWGLYDTIGNVWEWCLDWFGPYADGEAVDPCNDRPGEYRVNRGGGWSNGPRACRAAYRSIDPPTLRDDDIGFRLVWRP